MRGIDELRKAAEILRVPGGDARERLRFAADRFWAAVFHADSWPEALRSRAESLTLRIFRYGKIDEAAGRMGDKTAGEVSREILRLCEEADRLDPPPAP